ncbi:hypothetical protein [Micromonospora sp. D93]|uniref:hypothetical protein n=1 Tax=Micromonospora sp. D93 TaxID=2824886 RepID=UPI0027DDAD6F|nr:hypothetical protein [Micromonospora sp. D93]
MSPTTWAGRTLAALLISTMVLLVKRGARPKDIRYSIALRPVNKKPIPVCRYCQQWSRPKNYPPTIGFDPGSWGRGGI